MIQQYSHPSFKILQNLFPEFLNNFSQFPSLTEYNKLLHYKPILCASHKPIKAVMQRKKSAVFEEGYEPSVYLRGELQTRENNWHDFFNLMMWLSFPKTKAIINKWQYLKLKDRIAGTRRTHVENLLTQFDEGGMIVVSSNPQLIHFLKNHQWLDLFWHHRNKLNREMQFFLIGHAVYEKILNPYVGMTAPALIFTVEPALLQQELPEKIKLIDDLCANYIDNDVWHNSVRTLFTVPILGIPEWYSDNEKEDFYRNEKYFRARSK